ncbi:hypothetical protein ACJJTC_014497 [Scirpophaga incertulas]
MKKYKESPAYNVVSGNPGRFDCCEEFLSAKFGSRQLIKSYGELNSRRKKEYHLDYCPSAPALVFDAGSFVPHDISPPTSGTNKFSLFLVVEHPTQGAFECVRRYKEVECVSGCRRREPLPLIRRVCACARAGRCAVRTQLSPPGGA